MFQPVPGQFTMMTDPDRRYSWRALGTTQKGLVKIAGLTIDGREIPYEYRVEVQQDEPEDWYDIQLGAFGSSVVGQIDHGLTPVVFASAEEREAAVMVAIEATLAWLTIGRTQERKDGYNRATITGVQYCLGDFGPYFDSAGPNH